MGSETARLEFADALLPTAELVRRAFGLYERFRPEVPSDERGWGAEATLDPELIRKAAQAGRSSAPP